jgi:phosphoserine phosphatase RsbU/P
VFKNLLPLRSKLEEEKMLLNSIIKFVSSVEFAGIFFPVFIGIAAIVVYRKVRVPAVMIFAAMSIVWVLRIVAEYLSGEPLLQYLFEYIQIFLYYWFFQYYLGRKIYDVLAVLAIVVCFFVSFYIYVFAFPFERNLPTFIGLLAGYAYLFIRLICADRKDISRTAFIFSINRGAILFSVVPCAMLLFLDRNNSMIPVVVLTVPFALALYYMYRLFLFFERSNSVEMISKHMDSYQYFMNLIGDTITDESGMTLFYEYAVMTVVADTQAEGGAIFLYDKEKNSLRMEALHGRFPLPLTDSKDENTLPEKILNLESKIIPLNGTIIGDALKKRTVIYLPHTGRNSGVVNYNSIIISPIIINNEDFGVIAIGNSEGKRYLDPVHLDQLKTITEYIIMAVKNLKSHRDLINKKMLERDIDIAASIQKRMNRQDIPVLPDTQIACFTKALKGVSGDYLDVIQAKQGRTICVVCDVSGKGVPASLIMVMISTILYLVGRIANNKLSDIVSFLNKEIVRQTDDGLYATMNLISYDPKSRLLVFVNAGQYPLLLYRARTHTVEKIDTAGFPVGIDMSTRYESVETVLDLGDIICSFTDGITEQRNSQGEEFGQWRLEKILSENHEQSAEELLSIVKEELNVFAQGTGAADDQSLLIIKIDPKIINT